MTQELLPCPFCGGEASADGYVRYSRPLEDTFWEGGLPITEAHFCNCVKCGLTNQGVAGIGHQTKADAIAAWNRRAPQWQPIETAPLDEVVRVKAGEMTFLAALRPDASLDEDSETCAQWQAENEGEHPPCWSGGACWGANEDGIPSLQPTAWRPK